MLGASSARRSSWRSCSGCSTWTLPSRASAGSSGPSFQRAYSRAALLAISKTQRLCTLGKRLVHLTGERAAHHPGLEALAAAVREQASTVREQRVYLGPTCEHHRGLIARASGCFVSTVKRAPHDGCAQRNSRHGSKAHVRSVCGAGAAPGCPAGRAGARPRKTRTGQVACPRKQARRMQRRGRCQRCKHAGHGRHWRDHVWRVRCSLPHREVRRRGPCECAGHRSGRCACCARCTRTRPARPPAHAAGAPTQQGGHGPGRSTPAAGERSGRRRASGCAARPEQGTGQPWASGLMESPARWTP